MIIQGIIASINKGINLSYPTPGSGNYLSGSDGLAGVNYTEEGIGYHPSYVSSISNYAGGLYRTRYSGNWTPFFGADPSTWDMTFFQTNRGYASIADSYVSFGDQGDPEGNNYFSMEWKGYFQGPFAFPGTDNFNMFSVSDDEAVVWIGESALDGNYTNSNYAVRSSNGRDININTMELTSGEWYPIRIWFSEFTGNCNFQLFMQRSDNSRFNFQSINRGYNSVTKGFNP